nr:retrotransposon protein, putative, Ty1-copia subclass [Tanacetum cinerariifolium]
MTTSVRNNSVFRFFFEKQKLTGPNFINWYRQLRLVLSTEYKENYLVHPIPAAPVTLPGQQVPPQALAAHVAWDKGQKEELKVMYSKQAEQELLQIVREFHTSKQEEGQSVSSHVLKIKGYIDNLERLGQPVGQNLAKNTPRKATKGGHGKGKGKIGYASNNAPFAPKPKTPPPPKIDNHAKDAICHQCGEVGHWTRNYPVKSWIYDTGCGTRICITTQGLRGSKKLKPGALSPYVGNGHRAAVEAIGTYHLELPGGLVIVLNNFHYAPSITRGVISVSSLRLKVSGNVEDLELIQEEDTNPSVDTSLNHEEDDQEIDEPQSDINPIHPESKKWLDAMNVEMQSMKDNDVWVLVELPPNARTVGSMWLFKKKTNIDGAVYIFKARLVAKGFTQTYGVDYEEPFSPIADIRAIRILIAIAAYYDYEIWQMDVKTAFLNGHLSEEVYMEQPEGFVNLKYPNHVCKLKRSIYGLKQASRQSSGSYIAILILYVDDILLMGNNIPMLQDVKSYLGRSFAMKDLGDDAYILRIKIYRDSSKRLIGLWQKAYIEKILKRYYVENSKRGTIPMQEKLKLITSQGASTPAEKQHMQNIPYTLVVGSIMYDVRCTRPDVAFTQNMTSRFQQIPGKEHGTAVKNILKYLRNTKDMFLTGYVFVLIGGAVDWKSTKQSIFATSSTYAEYIVAFDALKETVGIRKFISGLGIVPTLKEPISIYCDNTGAIAIAKDD